MARAIFLGLFFLHSSSAARQLARFLASPFWLSHKRLKPVKLLKVTGAYDHVTITHDSSDEYDAFETTEKRN